MNFRKLQDSERKYGTSLMGYVTTTYARLVEVFGEPEMGGDKVTVEWYLKFSDGTVATIYDWKEYDTPMLDYAWHIGGYDSRAERAVKRALGVG